MSLQSRLHQIDELANERWLGISTAEWHQVHFDDRPDFRGYGPTSYRDWRAIRRHIEPRGSFIDYGAGLGRVTILAARLPFDRVIGIDLDRDLVERGNHNIGRARWLKCGAHILCQDAAAFAIPGSTTVLYFCNPFSGKVLSNVLVNIKNLKEPVSLICNLPPISGFEKEIRAVPWLSLKTEFALSYGRKCLILSSAQT